MDNDYHEGTVYDEWGQITGYNLNPNCFIRLSEKDIDDAIREKAILKLREIMERAVTQNDD